jgi:hypothetical protein
MPDRLRRVIFRLPNPGLFVSHFQIYRPSGGGGGAFQSLGFIMATGLSFWDRNSTKNPSDSKTWNTLVAPSPLIISRCHLVEGNIWIDPDTGTASLRNMRSLLLRSLRALLRTFEAFMV